MRKLMKLAGRQHSVFTREQALACGLSPWELRSKLRASVFERAAWGVYVIAGSPKTWRQKLMVAVLAAGPGAAVSGRAAAALLRIPGYREGPVEVTQPRRPSRRYKVAVEHSSRALPAEHIKVVDGIPVTSVDRTVFDLCGRMRQKTAERLVKAVVGRKLSTIGRLAVVLAELTAPGRPGVRMLRAVLAELADKPITESELEDLVLAVLRAAGLPLPERQVEVGGTTAPIGRIDFLYRQARFVIEADSRRWHGEWLATEADHRRDKLLIAAGFQITRTNWHELINEPELLVEAVRAVLARAAA
jgi:very-short-patch-repair endonuclease